MQSKHGLNMIIEADLCVQINKCTMNLITYIKYSVLLLKKAWSIYKYA